jgi:hypothetical protein
MSTLGDPVIALAEVVAATRVGDDPQAAAGRIGLEPRAAFALEKGMRARMATDRQLAQRFDVVVENLVAARGLARPTR